MESHAQTQLSWSDPAWLRAYGLRAEFALDYFANSAFYDKTCLNEQIKMQNVTPQDAPAMLQRMTGTEYRLFHAHEQPATEHAPPRSLYVIEKVRRTSEAGASTAQPLRYYYVLDGVVYEVPTLQAVVKARLLQLCWLLSEAYAQLDGPAAEPSDPAEPESVHADDAAAAEPARGGAAPTGEVVRKRSAEVLYSAGASECGADASPPRRKKRRS